MRLTLLETSNCVTRLFNNNMGDMIWPLVAVTTTRVSSHVSVKKTLLTFSEFSK